MSGSPLWGCRVAARSSVILCQARTARTSSRRCLYWDRSSRQSSPYVGDCGRVHHVASDDQVPGLALRNGGPVVPGNVETLAPAAVGLVQVSPCRSSWAYSPVPSRSSAAASSALNPDVPVPHDPCGNSQAGRPNRRMVLRDAERAVPLRDGEFNRSSPGNTSLVRVALRPAGPADAAFLIEMLVEAAFWRPDGPRGSVDEVSRQPELAHYVADWPRPGDLGIVAEAERPVGAAWLRFFTASDPGYGFVDVATPEVSMGVVREWRRQRIGARLLAALVTAAAREANMTALSLSVEPDNYARRLYERVGFQQIGQVGGSLTMLLRL